MAARLPSSVQVGSAGAGTEHGAGCDGELTMLRKCNEAPCEMKDCEFADWSPWSECNQECNGHRRRGKFSIARMDSGMVGNEAEANKNASHFVTPTSSHSKRFGQRWELDPLPVHLH